jgi:phytoene/squalene synthetase
MELFDETCFKCSELVTSRYSTSFSKGIKAFDKRFRYPIHAIYGFVRFADEIVDTMHQHRQRELLDTFKAETFRAIEQKISLNPILQSFQQTVNGYGIKTELIKLFLEAMEKDLDHKYYDTTDYRQYIYGSAEVVGLMCLRVFCEGDDQLCRKLQPYAQSLGAAFQKVNFLRDIKADLDERGRRYFPGVDFHNFTPQDKELIEADILADFEHALIGIKLLPEGARAGVYIAYVYYYRLFKKICRLSPSVILHHRVRISDTLKTYLYLQAMFRQKLRLV